jgi:hypothetical protein
MEKENRRVSEAIARKKEEFSGFMRNTWGLRTPFPRSALFL